MIKSVLQNFGIWLIQLHFWPSDKILEKQLVFKTTEQASLILEAIQNKMAADWGTGQF